MATRRRSKVIEAWEELVFHVIPWTVDERLRRWVELYNATWNGGEPLVEVDVATLVLSAGIGLYLEQGNYTRAFELTKVARTVIPKLQDEVDVENIISIEAYTRLCLGDEAGVLENVHELLDMRRPHFKGPIYSCFGLLVELVAGKNGPEPVDIEVREALARLLAMERKGRATARLKSAPNYSELKELLRAVAEPKGLRTLLPQPDSRRTIPS